MAGIRNSEKMPALFAILFAAAMWGASFISTKSLLISGLTPVQIAFVRFSIACMILVGLQILHGTGKRERPSNENPSKPPHNGRIRMMVGGIIGIPVYFLLENTGLRFTAASTASLITGTVPVINALALVLLLHSKISSSQWAGIVLSCFGVYVVTQADLVASISDHAMLGNFFILLSSCSWVAYTMINKPLLDYYDGLTLNTYQNVIGTICLIPFALHDGMPIMAWGIKVWLNILYLGVVCSALAYILYAFALKHLGSTVVTSFINLVPFFGVLSATILLGEPLSWMKALGGILAIAGVYLVSAGWEIRRPIGKYNQVSHQS